MKRGSVGSRRRQSARARLLSSSRSARFEQQLLNIRKKCGREVILDGEFYRHGWTLDRIAEAVSLFRRRPVTDTFEVGFSVFDLVDITDRRVQAMDLHGYAVVHIPPRPENRVECDCKDWREHHVRLGWEQQELVTILFRCGTEFHGMYTETPA